LEVPPDRRERVRHGDRRPGPNAPLADACLLQLAQALREHPLGQAGHGAGQLAEAGGALEQEVDDEAAPALAEELEHVGRALAELQLGARGRRLDRGSIRAWALP